MNTRAILCAVAAALAVAACDRQSADRTETAAAAAADASFKDQRAEIALGASLGHVRGAVATSPSPPPTAARAPRTEQLQERQARTVVAATNMVIRNGAVSIEVDSVEAAVARVRTIAASFGGYVGSVSIQNGEHQVRSASLELKIPNARFDSAMSGMPALGKVEYSSTSAEDVGEEFVDLTARAENATRLEARLITLLATRTGKLDDVLKVERELARVREEIERHEGRLRYLTTRVAMSTINATVHEKMPVIAAAPGRNILVEAFKNMWRNFVRILVLGIEMLGVALPVLLLALASYWVFRRWRHRRLLPTQ